MATNKKKNQKKNQNKDKVAKPQSTADKNQDGLSEEQLVKVVGGRGTDVSQGVQVHGGWDLKANQKTA